MASFYCEYCGTKASSIVALTATSCSKHPQGVNKGKHKLYEGGEKSEYFCKYCGTKATNIVGLTSTTCSRHPEGTNKGKHLPAL